MLRPYAETLIRDAIARHLDLDRVWVFLFGSRASGYHEPASDYDVGLYADRVIPLSILAKIRDDLEESRLVVDVDFVDFALVSDGFRHLALENLTIWNRPKNGCAASWLS